MVSASSRWAWTCVGAGGVFLGLAAAASLGVSPLERHVYGAITTALPDEHSHLFFWLTRLGARVGLVPVGVFLIALMPRPLLRRWWLWGMAILLVVVLEGAGKTVLGRPRPEDLRPGFPSGHTAAAAAFYMVAGYFAALRAARRWRWAIYGTVATVSLLVGLSRIVRRAHWPLDAAGGLALGVAVFAAAAWWHERYPVAVPARPSPLLRGLCEAVHRWQVAIPVPFFAVVLLSPPIAADDRLADLALDAAGVALVAAGLWLRLWAAGHAERRPLLPARPPTRLVTAGPYAHMRHPLLLAHALTGIGIVTLGESGPGLILVPAVLIAVYRMSAAVEEASLRARHGGAFAGYCARVPSLPRPTRALLADAARVPVAAFRAELPVVAGVLALAVIADLSEYLPRLWP